MTDVVIGVDVGGSGVRAVAVTEDGTVEGAIRSVPITKRTRGEIQKAIATVVAQTSTNGVPKAVGVGLPAFLRRPEGTVALAPNLPQLNGWNAADEIMHQVKLPVLVENDANAAAFGESWAGAGRMQNPFVYLGLGTGVGGGIVLNGQLLHGIMGLAGELGHLTVFPDGALCGCGANGCLEAYASATGLLRAFNEDTRQMPDAVFDPLYGNRTALTADDLARLANEGDAMAFRVFAHAGTALGIAIGQIAHTLNPEGIAIGGGVAESWELLWPTLWGEVMRRTPDVLRERMWVRPASLGDQAGAIGAAGLAWAMLHAA